MFAFVLCAAVQIINLTDSWVKIDDQNLAVAEKRCTELYPNSPCLKKFIKKEERVYQAICGI